LDILIFGIVALLWWVWTYTNRATFNDFLSPFNLLLYLWVIPFVLSFLNWSGLQRGLSFEAAAIILICTLILVSISVIPMRRFRGAYLKVGLPHLQGLTDSRIVRYLVVGLYFVSLAAMYFAEFRDGLPIFEYLSEGVDDASLHLAGKDSKLQVIAQGLMVAGAFCYYTAMNTESKTSRFIYFLLAMTVPLLGVLKASKSGVFTPALYYAAIYYYLKISWGERPLTTRAITLLAGSFVLMVSITSIRVLGTGATSGYSGAIEFRYADELIFPLNEIVATIYGYTALGFQNFSDYLPYDDGTLRIGTSFFRPLLSMLMQGEWVREMSVPKSAWHVMTPAATTGTYLRDLYMEGGILLCLFGSLFYASFINWLYVKFRRAGGGFWFFIYIIMLFPWVWMFFQNAFSILSFYTNAFYVVAIFAIAKLLRWTLPNVVSRSSSTSTSGVLNNV